MRPLPLGIADTVPPASAEGLDICRELERMLSPPVKFAPTSLDSVMRSLTKEDGGTMFRTPASGDGIEHGIPAGDAVVALKAEDTANDAVPPFEARLMEQEAGGDGFCAAMDLPLAGADAVTPGCAPLKPLSPSTTELHADASLSVMASALMLSMHTRSRKR